MEPKHSIPMQIQTLYTQWAMKMPPVILPVALTIIGGVFGWLLFSASPKPVSRNITIQARQYSYDPEKLEVNIGDTLHIRLVSLDVFHGFFLEGYDVDAEVQANLKAFKIRHPSEGFNWKEVDELCLIASRRGLFKYRCSHTCGTMHPFMQGELIVRPNTPLHAGLGGVIGFACGMLLMYYRKNPSPGDENNV